MKYVFAFIVLVHGLIHLMGFSKAFGVGQITSLTRDISKQTGAIWLLAALLFLIAGTGYLFKKEWWPVIAAFGVVVSQILIILSWQDAKFGTIANVIILMMAMTSRASQLFEARFREDVRTNLIQTHNDIPDLLTEQDLASLPAPVQKYIRYTGAIGKDKVKNVRIAFEGEMRSKKMNWFKFNTVQYNFMKEPTRLFYMKAKIVGMYVPGYHKYLNGAASMQVKLGGLWNVVNKNGTEMDQAETVTVLNDLCLMAPAALIDDRIRWVEIDDLTTKVVFTNRGHQISAILYFNETGQLINFVSDDRYDISDTKRYRFSTPVMDYKSIDGRNVVAYGQAVWHYPEGEFVYGKFYLKNIEYNVRELQD
ncbi:MAG: DUF6544 family protein [Saprospiraceae bacterium]|nr:hypothetical protein [Saprospiraceae bacterium]